MVIQDDLFDATDSVTVCPFTTTVADAHLLRFPVMLELERRLATLLGLAR